MCMNMYEFFFQLVSSYSRVRKEVMEASVPPTIPVTTQETRSATIFSRGAKKRECTLHLHLLKSMEYPREYTVSIPIFKSTIKRLFHLTKFYFIWFYKWIKLFLLFSSVKNLSIFFKLLNFLINDCLRQKNRIQPIYIVFSSRHQNC